jgi:putative hydrolases of HD superfamily
MESPKNTEKSLLKLEASASEVYSKLDALKRTGWVNCGIENPESVKEHTEALIRLAGELSEYLTTEEQDGLIDMLEVHDWPEAIHGDEVILEVNPGDKKALLEAKFENEKRALEDLCKNIPNGKEILSLWLRFETSDDAAATFARELDKYQAVEKALEYEEMQNIPLFEEFLNYSIRYINHPILLERIERLRLRWKGV